MKQWKFPRHVLISYLVLTAVLLAGQSTAAPNRIALVIGNSHYESAPLTNPANDARDMAAKLSELGFDVIVFTDLNRKAMREAIRNFGERLKHSQVGLFYFAGHGIQIHGENYLIPVGTDVRAADEVEDESISAYSILRKMESAANEVNIVILDACRNNPFARSFRSLEQGLAKMDGPIGSFIAYATAPGSVAADGSGRNGLYTQHLLRALSQPSLSIEQTFKAVRRGVSEDTNGMQIPWESSSLTGEFYFRPLTQAQTLKPINVKPPPTPIGYLQIIGNVPNAVVTVNHVERGRLNAAGVLNISPLSGEEVEVAIAAPGYQTINDKVELIPGQWRQYQVMLEPSITKDKTFRDSTSVPNSAKEANSNCLRSQQSIIVGIRSEWTPSSNPVVQLNEPSLYATVLNGLQKQEWKVIDVPAEMFDSNAAQMALKSPAYFHDGYWLKVFVSAQETPITTIQTNMKTVHGNISLQLVDLSTQQVLSATTTKFRKAGLDMGAVVNHEIDAQLPLQMQSLLNRVCQKP